MAKQKREIIVTIKDGQINVDQVGFVGTECVKDALFRTIKKMGRLIKLERKKGGRERPVHDNSIIDMHN